MGTTACRSITMPCWPSTATGPGSHPIRWRRSSPPSCRTTLRREPRPGLRATEAGFPTWEQVRDAPLAELIEAVRPAGLGPTAKPPASRRRCAASAMSAVHHRLSSEELPLEEARAWLLSIPGVGPKRPPLCCCSPSAAGFPRRYPTFHRVGRGDWTDFRLRRRVSRRTNGWSGCCHPRSTTRFTST